MLGHELAHLGPIAVAQQLGDHARKGAEEVALPRRAGQVCLARAVDFAADALAPWTPSESDKTRTIVMRGRRVRGGKGVAVELGVDGHGADLRKPTK